ncbi:MAG: hypothetical protein ACT4P1_08700 [Sporichthyaceae bacterium]
MTDSGLNALDPTEARRTLERYVAEPMPRGHADYLREYLPSIGHGDLVAHITGPGEPPR